jgi:hypothetical protein
MLWQTYHAFAVGGNAFVEDGVAELIETFFWVASSGTREKEHVEIRHGGLLWCFVD